MPGSSHGAIGPIPDLEDYATSRRQLLAGARDAGATLERYEVNAAGPAGEPLSTDVARFGPPPGKARAVIVVSSGTHGVEGHAGWGLQMLMLSRVWVHSSDSEVAVLIVHSVNPFGMAWSRRVDQDNVDVNRNFVDFDEPLPRNPLYDRVAPVLNPADLDPDDTSWQQELWKFVDEVGMTEAFRAISGGQYHSPGGMQFGGLRPSPSALNLRRIWQRHLAQAALVVHLDVHTGLGPTGQLTLFQTADAEEQVAQLATQEFGVIVRTDRSSTADALNSGLLGPGLDAAAPEIPLCIPLVVEFGTLPEVDVLAAMRADNWLHQHGDPSSALSRQLRARTRDAFFVRDRSWRQKVADQGMATIRTALDMAQDPVLT